MKSLAALLAVGALSLLSAEAIAAPTVPEGYTVELYASGIGAATAMALGPDGSLYITDYVDGRLLKRTPSGTLEVVTSSVPVSSALAVLPSGRIFIGANTFYIYEVVGGTPQLFASGLPYLCGMGLKGDDLYTANSGGNSISRVSTITGAVTTELSGVINPCGVSFDVLGNMYFVSHAVGEVYTYNFVDPPRRLAAVTPYGGTYTAVGFDGRLFWSDVVTGTIYTLKDDRTAAPFATGFVGKNPPVNGPNAIVAQGTDVIFVADGPNVWRIARRPEAAGVLQERSMQVSQMKSGGWMVRCTVQYMGVNGNHQHRVAIDMSGPGISAGVVTAEVGPAERSFILQDAGVQNAKIVLSPGQLWMERAAYLSAAPGHGDLYWCEGSGQDTTSGGYLRTTHMEDVSQ